MQKYLGKKVIIVYQDQHKRFSQRRIKVLGQEGEMIKAYCYTSNAEATFNKRRILSVSAPRPKGKKV